jgi:hypothetical protein
MDSTYRAPTGLGGLMDRKLNRVSKAPAETAYLEESEDIGLI